jgi:hypothetical protein
MATRIDRANVRAAKAAKRVALDLVKQYFSDVDAGQAKYPIADYLVPLSQIMHEYKTCINAVIGCRDLKEG